MELNEDQRANGGEPLRARTVMIIIFSFGKRRGRVILDDVDFNDIHSFSGRGCFMSQATPGYITVSVMVVQVDVLVHCC